jgi:hypothetical protein
MDFSNSRGWGKEIAAIDPKCMLIAAKLLHTKKATTFVNINP